MMRPGEQDGSTSIIALVLLLLLSAVAAGGALVLRASLSHLGRSIESQDLEQSLREEGENVIRALCRDPSPESDSPLDPVWDAIKKPQTDGVTITLKDISSALNPNWVRKNVLQKTVLTELFRLGISADDLQQRREDKGFSTDIISAYGDLFREGMLEKYFTGYGYANINVTDEFALRKLYIIRTGDDAGAGQFHTRVQKLLVEKKLLRTGELKDFLGVEYGDLYPLLNVESTLNVQFADTLLLSALLGYPDFRVPQPEQAVDLIVQRRGIEELTADELRRIIGAAGDSRIYQYLGVITWFWKITVCRQVACLELVVARLPADNDESSQFLVIEERYVR